MKNLFKMVVMVFSAFSVVSAASLPEAPSEKLIKWIFFYEAQGLDRTKPASAVELCKRMEKCRSLDGSVTSQIVNLLNTDGFVVSLIEFESAQAPITLIQEFLRQDVCFRDCEIVPHYKDCPLFFHAIMNDCPRVVAAVMANFGDRRAELFEVLLGAEHRKPLFSAVFLSPKCFVVMLEWILKHEDYFSRAFQAKNDSLQTILHVAASWAKNGIFQRLLREINKVEGLLVKLLCERDSMGDTVIYNLLNSMNSGSFRDIQVLIGLIFNMVGEKALEFINIRNNRGETPLESLKNSGMRGKESLVLWLEAAILRLETTASAPGGACSGAASSHS